MSSERIIPTDPVSQPEDPLTQMSRSEFVAGWKALVGEPPATLLDNRSEMIRVLVASTPIVPPAGASVAAADDQVTSAQSLLSPARASS